MPLPLRHPSPARSWQLDGGGGIGTAAIGLFAISAVIAVLAPLWFWLPLATGGAAGLGLVAFRHATALCVVWLLIAGRRLK